MMLFVILQYSLKAKANPFRSSGPSAAFLPHGSLYLFKALKALSRWLNLTASTSQAPAHTVDDGLFANAPASWTLQDRSQHVHAGPPAGLVHHHHLAKILPFQL